jgi:deoxyribose-phosphate aldolase
VRKKERKNTNIEIHTLAPLITPLTTNDTTSHQTMAPTTRYTDPEWTNIIASTVSAVKSSERPKYPLPKSIPGTIDHTLLKLDATPEQIDNLCAEARVHGFATVCVRPNWVSRCVSNLKGSPVGVASVVGFHEGTGDLYQKLE